MSVFDDSSQVLQIVPQSAARIALVLPSLCALPALGLRRFLATRSPERRREEQPSPRPAGVRHRQLEREGLVRRDVQLRHDAYTRAQSHQSHTD